MNFTPKIPERLGGFPTCSAFLGRALAIRRFGDDIAPKDAVLNEAPRLKGGEE